MTRFGLAPGAALSLIVGGAAVGLSRRNALTELCAAVSSGALRRQTAAASGADDERFLGGASPGLFPDCSVACVSSQDDRPSAWDNPWIAEEEPLAAMSRLRGVLEERLGGRVVEADGRYLRLEFSSSGPLGGEAIDDAEFYFAPDDVLVQFRAARRGDAPSDFGANRQRLERARMMLGWEKVEVRMVVS